MNSTFGWSRVDRVCGRCVVNPGGRAVGGLVASHNGAAIVTFEAGLPGVCSWVKVLVTVEVVGWPVSGSVQATWSPTATSSMGLVVPSAMRTGVPAGKQALRPTEETAPTPAPMVPPMAAPRPVAPRRPPTVWGPGPST